MSVSIHLSEEYADGPRSVLLGRQPITRRQKDPLRKLTPEEGMDKIWAGIDAGKEVHWARVLDASGTELLSRKVENDEADLLKLIDEALAFAGRSQVVWAIASVRPCR